MSLTLDAGFDPFHETQKGLADLLESEAAEAQQTYKVHTSHLQLCNFATSHFVYLRRHLPTLTGVPHLLRHRAHASPHLASTLPNQLTTPLLNT